MVHGRKFFFWGMIHISYILLTSQLGWCMVRSFIHWWCVFYIFQIVAININVYNIKILHNLFGYFLENYKKNLQQARSASQNDGGYVWAAGSAAHDILTLMYITKPPQTFFMILMLNGNTLLWNHVELQHEKLHQTLLRPNIKCQS